MKTLLAALAFCFVCAGASQAMPLTPPDHSSSNIVQVAGGCGPGWHRGPRGGCRRNYARPWRHACPRGYHLGPRGRCRGNFR